MSTLITATVKSNSSSPPAFQNTSGTEIGTLCRAWVNFDGTFGTSPFTTGNGGIRASFNVSSITDNGTGDYTTTFTNALADANFCVVFAGSETVSFGTGSRVFTAHRTESTTTVRSETVGGNGDAFDAIKYSLAVFR